MAGILDTLPETGGVRFVIDNRGRIFGAVRGEAYIPIREFTEDVMEILKHRTDNGNGHA